LAKKQKAAAEKKVAALMRLGYSYLRALSIVEADQRLLAKARQNADRP